MTLEEITHVRNEIQRARGQGLEPRAVLITWKQMMSLPNPEALARGTARAYLYDLHCVVDHLHDGLPVVLSGRKA